MYKPGGKSKVTFWAAVRMARLAVLVLGLAAAGAFLSDAGVRADEADDAVQLRGPENDTAKTQKARVLRIDSHGWLEVTRTGQEQPGVVTVVTGFDCRNGGGLCAELGQGEFEQVAGYYRELAEAGMDDLATRRGLANALYLEGDLAGAVRTYVWAWSDFPGDPDVRNGLGNSLAGLGILSQAHEEFASLAEHPIYRAVALNNLGAAYHQANRLEQAVEEYRRSSEEDPDLVAAHFNRGVALMAMDQMAEAAATFGQVTRRAPGLAEGFLNEGLALLRSGQSIRAAVALHRARDLAPDSPPVALALGLASQEVGLDAQAVDLFRVAARAMPQDERIYHLLANSLVRTGRSSQAAEVLKQAFELAPRDADDHFQLGLKLFLCDQPQPASAHFLKAMSQGRRDADLFFALGQSLLQSGQTEAAVKSLSVASRMKPSAAEIHFSLGVALAQSDDMPGALREVKTAVALDPADSDLQVALIGMLLRAGDFAGCARAGRRLVAQHPELVQPRYDLALCLALDGSLDRAAESLEDALDHDLDGTGVHALWRRVGLLVDARAELPGPYLLLAMIHERRGNWNEAVVAYERFILVKPEPAWVGKALRRIHSLAPEPIEAAAGVPAP